MLKKKKNFLKDNEAIEKSHRHEILTQINSSRKSNKLVKKTKDIKETIDNESIVNDTSKSASVNVIEVNVIKDEDSNEDIDENESIEYIENVSSKKDTSVTLRLDECTDKEELIPPIDTSKLILKDMKSLEDVKEKEQTFKDLIKLCKSSLTNILRLSKNTDVNFEKVMNKTWEETREHRETFINNQINETESTQNHYQNSICDNIDIHKIEVKYDSNGQRNTISTSSIKYSNDRYLDEGVKTLISRQLSQIERKPSRNNIFIHTNTTTDSIMQPAATPTVGNNILTESTIENEKSNIKASFSIGFDIRTLTNSSLIHSQGPLINDSSRLE